MSVTTVTSAEKEQMTPTHYLMRTFTSNSQESRTLSNMSLEEGEEWSTTLHPPNDLTKKPQRRLT